MLPNDSRLDCGQSACASGETYRCEGGALTSSHGCTPSPPEDAGNADAGGTEAGLEAGPPSPVQAKKVFVTSHTYSGDLATAAGAADGSSGADILCNRAAGATNLAGTWFAWISTTSGDAIDRVDEGSSYSLLDGTLVFPDRASITDVGPRHAIDLDEMMMRTVPSTTGDDVWTGTNRLGRLVAPDGQTPSSCANFTRATGTGESGHIADPTAGVGDVGAWTDRALADSCGDRLHLYCFER